MRNQRALINTVKLNGVKSMSDYRLIIRVKNNLLHRQMVAAGISTQSELARVTGLGPNVIGDIANLKIGAFNANGKPSKATQALCEYFGCLPEDIYPKEVLHVGIPGNVVERFVSSEEVSRYIQQDNADPAYLLEEISDSEFFQREISRLTSREQLVVRMRYYENAVYDEIGEILGVTGETVRQIERRAIEKIKGNVAKSARAAEGVWTHKTNNASHH